MKRSLFRLQQANFNFCAIAVSLGIFVLGNACSSNCTMGQESDPAEYSVHWLPMPTETTGVWVNEVAMFTDATGVAESAFVIGWHGRTDRAEKSGFIYDHFGTIDPSKLRHFYDILDPDLGVQFPPAWLPDAVGTSFIGVNSSGRIVGSVFGPDQARFGFYLDLFPVDVDGNPIPRELKQIAPPSELGNKYYGSDVNEAGDILVGNYDENSVGYPYIQNPDTGEYIIIPVLTLYAPHFNLSRQVFGKTDDQITYRHTITMSDGSGVTELFPEVDVYANSGRINDEGEFSAIIRKTKGRTKGVYAAIFGSDGNIKWQTGTMDNSLYLESINQSGDVVYGTNGDYWLHQDEFDQDYFVRDLVTNLDLTFQNSRIDLLQVGDRDRSGHSWIVGRAVTDNGNSYNRGFLLIPHSVDPTPGITVTPTDGLVTSEWGGTDTFEIVLNTLPTADVTITVSSSNTSEGTVDTASVTFTPGDWDTPQTVTVTGVDDGFDDGDVGYSIVTSAASSADLGYNGLNVDDVTVTNLDDEGPLVYSSKDTPTNIQDRGMAFSTIDVGDDFLIVDLIVTLNISHSRPSDLDVFLVRSGFADVQLFNFSGDNNVADFIGTSTFGDWTIEVYDNRKKKTGKLNGWSMTVE